jgi:hypothetical protein
LYFLENSLAIETFKAKEMMAMFIAQSIISGTILKGGTKGLGILKYSSK